MIDRIDNFFAPTLRALNLRTARSEVLAANIANSDTPHYQARDFSFANALQAARDGSFGMQRTSERHLEGRSTTPAMAAMQYRVPVQPSIDGNTVEMDTELAEFSNNAIGMQADLNFMNGKIRSLLAALQSQ
jgi:flagellar basal-body rod protein FlgB